MTSKAQQQLQTAALRSEASRIVKRLSAGVTGTELASLVAKLQMCLTTAQKALDHEAMAIEMLDIGESLASTHPALAANLFFQPALAVSQSAPTTSRATLFNSLALANAALTHGTKPDLEGLALVLQSTLVYPSLALQGLTLAYALCLATAAGFPAATLRLLLWGILCMESSTSLIGLGLIELRAAYYGAAAALLAAANAAQLLGRGLDKIAKLESVLTSSLAASSAANILTADSTLDIAGSFSASEDVGARRSTASGAWLSLLGAPSAVQLSEEITRARSLLYMCAWPSMAHSIPHRVLQPSKKSKHGKHTVLLAGPPRSLVEQHLNAHVPKALRLVAVLSALQSTRPRVLGDGLPTMAAGATLGDLVEAAFPLVLHALLTMSPADTAVTVAHVLCFSAYAAVSPRGAPAVYALHALLMGHDETNAAPLYVVHGPEAPDEIHAVLAPDILTAPQVATLRLLLAVADAGKKVVPGLKAIAAYAGVHCSAVCCVSFLDQQLMVDLAASVWANVMGKTASLFEAWDATAMSSATLAYNLFLRAGPAALDDGVQFATVAVALARQLAQQGDWLQSQSVARGACNAFAAARAVASTAFSVSVASLAIALHTELVFLHALAAARGGTSFKQIVAQLGAQPLAVALAHVAVGSCVEAAALLDSDSQVTADAHATKIDAANLVVVRCGYGAVTLQLASLVVGAPAHWCCVRLLGRTFSPEQHRLRVTDTLLAGSGVPARQNPTPPVFHVSGLDPLGSYVFALAFYDTKDKLLAVGPATPPLFPTPLLCRLTCWHTLACMPNTPLPLLIRVKSWVETQSPPSALRNRALADITLACTLQQAPSIISAFDPLASVSAAKAAQAAGCLAAQAHDGQLLVGCLRLMARHLAPMVFLRFNRSDDAQKLCLWWHQACCEVDARLAAPLLPALAVLTWYLGPQLPAAQASVLYAQSIAALATEPALLAPLQLATQPAHISAVMTLIPLRHAYDKICLARNDKNFCREAAFIMERGLALGFAAEVAHWAADAVKGFLRALGTRAGSVGGKTTDASNRRFSQGSTTPALSIKPAVTTAAVTTAAPLARRVVPKAVAVRAIREFVEQHPWDFSTDPAHREKQIHAMAVLSTALLAYVQDQRSLRLARARRAPKGNSLVWLAAVYGLGGRAQFALALNPRAVASVRASAMFGAVRQLRHALVLAARTGAWGLLFNIARALDSLGRTAAAHPVLVSDVLDAALAKAYVLGAVGLFECLGSKSTLLRFNSVTKPTGVPCAYAGLVCVSDCVTTMATQPDGIFVANFVTSGVYRAKALGRTARVQALVHSLVEYTAFGVDLLPIASTEKTATADQVALLAQPTAATLLLSARDMLRDSSVIASAGDREALEDRAIGMLVQLLATPPHPLQAPLTWHLWAALEAGCALASQGRGERALALWTHGVSLALGMAPEHSLTRWEAYRLDFGALTCRQDRLVAVVLLGHIIRHFSVLQQSAKTAVVRLAACVLTQNINLDSAWVGATDFSVPGLAEALHDVALHLFTHGFHVASLPIATLYSTFAVQVLNSPTHELLATLLLSRVYATLGLWTRAFALLHNSMAGVTQTTFFAGVNRTPALPFAPWPVFKHTLPLCDTVNVACLVAMGQAVPSASAVQLYETMPCDAAETQVEVEMRARVAYSQAYLLHLAIDRFEWGVAPGPAPHSRRAQSSMVSSSAADDASASAMFPPSLLRRRSSTHVAFDTLMTDPAIADVHQNSALPSAVQVLAELALELYGVAQTQLSLSFAASTGRTRLLSKMGQHELALSNLRKSLTTADGQTDVWLWIELRLDVAKDLFVAGAWADSLALGEIALSVAQSTGAQGLREFLEWLCFDCRRALGGQPQHPAAQNQHDSVLPPLHCALLALRAARSFESAFAAVEADGNAVLAPYTLASHLLGSSVNVHLPHWAVLAELVAHRPPAPNGSLSEYALAFASVRLCRLDRRDLEARLALQLAQFTDSETWLTSALLAISLPSRSVISLSDATAAEGLWVYGLYCIVHGGDLDLTELVDHSVALAAVTSNCAVALFALQLAHVARRARAHLLHPSHLLLACLPPCINGSDRLRVDQLLALLRLTGTHNVEGHLRALLYLRISLENHRPARGGGFLADPRGLGALVRVHDHLVRHVPAFAAECAILPDKLRSLPIAGGGPIAVSSWRWAADGGAFLRAVICGSGNDELHCEWYFSSRAVSAIAIAFRSTDDTSSVRLRLCEALSQSGVTAQALMSREPSTACDVAGLRSFFDFHLGGVLSNASDVAALRHILELLPTVHHGAS